MTKKQQQQTLLYVFLLWPVRITKFFICDVKDTGKLKPRERVQNAWKTAPKKVTLFFGAVFQAWRWKNTKPTINQRYIYILSVMFFSPLPSTQGVISARIWDDYSSFKTWTRVANDVFTLTPHIDWVSSLLSFLRDHCCLISTSYCVYAGALGALLLRIL